MMGFLFMGEVLGGLEVSGIVKLAKMFLDLIGLISMSLLKRLNPRLLINERDNYPTILFN